jgi:L-threonylcarbamoyladenylate synthase
MDSDPKSEGLVPASGEAIARAAAYLRAGRQIVFPTETVYGVGADATNEAAVAGIFALKERPRFNPLIVHVWGLHQAGELARFHGMAAELAEAFWPGGLTLVLPRVEPSPLALLASAGSSSVAVRAPAHPVARALIEAAKIPIAAPSANRSGRISPTTAEAAQQELGGRVAMILDGGPCPIGLESTIIGFSGGRAVMLRPGAVPRAEIEAVTGPLLEPESGSIAAPGMMASHYAPRARLRLDARDVRPGEALLGFGADAPASAVATCNLSPAGDLREAAANLFAMLRRLDASGASAIAVMPVPHHGLGEAINDRLARAAAPREE